ncbi:MAG: condensation domain-containing protein, partial [Psychrosphaera sp.]|nr:condensation domain-containing protein [Psychrosphaera sp.]
MSTDFKQILVMCEQQGVEISVNEADLDIFFDDYPSDELVDLIKTHKPGLIDYLSQRNQRLENNMKLLPVDVVSRQQAGYQLSFSQQRIWFVEQLEPGTAQFTMPGVFELKGEVNPAWVEQSFAAIVKRHWVLSTHYDKDKLGNPLQRLNANAQFKLSQLDLSGVHNSRQQSLIDNEISDNTHHSFDLSTDLMLKVRLIKKADKQWLLLMALHHIAADGLSIGLLLKEFKANYLSFSSETSTDLPAVDVQYIDYANWQQTGFEQGLLSPQADYWRDKLAQLPLVHSLPTDFSRGQQPSYEGAVEHLLIDQPLLARLDSLCAAKNTSRFTLLYAVYSCLIARYANNADVVIGTPAANRDRAEFESLIGLFVNSLVLRLSVDEGASFEQLLDLANTTLLDAQQNKDIPFEVIVENLNPQRSSTVSPLFQLFFTMNSVEQDSISGFDIKPVELNERVAKYDLTLCATRIDDQIKLGFEYSKALFKPAFIQQFAGHFITLLSQVLDNPQAGVYDHQMMDDSEISTAMGFAGGQVTEQKIAATTLHQLVEAQSLRTPKADALVCKDLVWSHQTLQHFTNVFANQLIEKGVQSGDKVAIALQRNSAAIAWALAILKVGGAYVPLDASMPLSRLEFITTDADVKLVVTDNQFGPA